MDTTIIDERARLIGATKWAAIASGVFIALALQFLLVSLGLGIALHDERVGGGFGTWVVLAQLVSLAVGGALTARLSHPHSRAGGMVAGLMTWAVALVVGAAFQNLAMIPRVTAGWAWEAFFGAVLGLAAALVGGWLGGTYHGTSSTPTYREDTPSHAEL